LNCHTQESAPLIQFYGISKHPINNDYFIVKQFHKNTSPLMDYISHNFNNLNWEKKLHLLLYLSEHLKALHNAGYVHRYFKHPSSVLVLDDSFCAIESFLECKALTLSNIDEIGGWHPYKAPEILVRQPYTKASDIYSFGMIMHAIGTGNIPPYDFPLHFNHFNQCITFDICFGLRPYIPDNIPKSFKNLVESCWNTEPGLRPNIHEVHSALSNIWLSIYHNNHSVSLNLICLEFLAADNNNDYSKSESQEIIPQSSNLEPLEMIQYIKENNLVKVFNISELTIIIPINNDHICKISKATLKREIKETKEKKTKETKETKETNILVACRRIKSAQLDKAFFHELKKHKKFYLNLRILRVFGISLGKFR
jgi:serine/threonine protein kinase